MSIKEQKTSDEMKKTLSLWNYFTIGFGAIMGTGWLLMVGDWIELGGGIIAPMLAFAIGSIMLFPVGAVFGELSAAMPISGGTVVHIEKAFGFNVSYIASWFLALGNAIICTWEAIAIGTLIGEIFPILKSFPIYSIAGCPIYLPTMLIALVITFAIIFMNHRGVEDAAWLQSAMTKILFAGIIMSIGISIFKGSPSNALPLFETTKSTPDFWHGFILVLVMTPFFYAGFHNITQQAEEAKEGIDYKKFGSVIGLALLSSGLFYLICIYAFGTMVPWKEFITFPIPALTVLDKGLGLTIIAKLLLFAATCGIISTLNSFYGSCARILLGMARLGQLPNSFTKLHPVYKTPLYGNILMAVITLVGPFLGKNFLVPLTNVSSLAFMFACFLVSCSALKLRFSKPNLNRPYKVPFGIAGIVMAILASFIVVFLMLFPNTPAALKPVEWLIIIIWILLGWIFMLLRRKRNNSIGQIEDISKKKVSK